VGNGRADGARRKRNSTAKLRSSNRSMRLPSVLSPSLRASHPARR
jgi:hypothetical protein